jgi:hypothetical protein
LSLPPTRETQATVHLLSCRRRAAGHLEAKLREHGHDGETVLDLAREAFAAVVLRVLLGCNPYLRTMLIGAQKTLHRRACLHTQSAIASREQAAGGRTVMGDLRASPLSQGSLGSRLERAHRFVLLGGATTERRPIRRGEIEDCG